MGQSKIEWTDAVWNPVTGCTKCASGCRNCYAARMALRLRGRYGYPPVNPFAVTRRPDRLSYPRSLTSPRRIFVCSMGDLFHDDVPFEYIAEVFFVMADPWGELPVSHTFQVLTKRPQRMLLFFEWLTRQVDHRAAWLAALARRYRDYQPPRDIWMGVSASIYTEVARLIPLLLGAPAAVRFLSLEPLLERIVLNIPPSATYSGWTIVERDCGLHWVIVGAESGPGRRWCDSRWAESIVAQCITGRVPVFVKQLHDEYGSIINAPTIHGRTWTQMPGDASV